MSTLDRFGAVLLLAATVGAFSAGCKAAGDGDKPNPFASLYEQEASDEAAIKQAALEDPSFPTATQPPNPGGAADSE